MRKEELSYKKNDMQIHEIFTRGNPKLFENE